MPKSLVYRRHIPAVRNPPEPLLRWGSRLGGAPPSRASDDTFAQPG